MNGIWSFRLNEALLLMTVLDNLRYLNCVIHFRIEGMEIVMSVKFHICSNTFRASCIFINIPLKLGDLSVTLETHVESSKNFEQNLPFTGSDIDLILHSINLWMLADSIVPWYDGPFIYLIVCKQLKNPVLFFLFRRCDRSMLTLFEPFNKSIKYSLISEWRNWTVNY